MTNNNEQNSNVVKTDVSNKASLQKPQISENPPEAQAIPKTSGKPGIYAELEQRNTDTQVQLQKVIDQLNQLAQMKLKLEAQAHALSGQLQLMSDVLKQHAST